MAGVGGRLANSRFAARKASDAPSGEHTMRRAAPSPTRSHLILAALALAAAGGCSPHPSTPPRPPDGPPTPARRPIEEVRARLDHPDHDTRMEAAAALAEYGKEAVPDLVAFARKTNAGPEHGLERAQEVSSATGALEKIGADAVPALVELLGEPGFLANSAATALGHMGEVARPAVGRALKDPDPRIRAGAVGTIRDVGVDPPLDVQAVLWDMTKDPKARVRVAAVEQLRLNNNSAEYKRFVPVLIDGLKDPDVEVRQSAGFHLCGLKRWNRDGSGKITSVDGIGDEAVLALRDALRDADAHVRLSAAAALVEMARDFDAAVPVALAELNSPDMMTRYSALDALAHFRRSELDWLTGEEKGRRDRLLPQVVKALWGLLARPEKEGLVRDSTRDILKDIGPDASTLIPALKGAVEEPDEQVRADAKELLEAINVPGPKK
jgi:HEAT repeat protein